MITLKEKENRFGENRQAPFFANKIDYLKHKKVKTVLDAGCGDGRNFLDFAKAGFKVTGVDLSDSALNKCKKYSKNYPNVVLSQQDIETLEFDLESFQLIICDHTLCHMKNPEKVIENFYNILETGGLALIEFTSIKDPLFGLGKKIFENQYIQNKFYIRFFTLTQIEKLVNRFKILVIDSELYSEPEHGPGYFRKKRHTHHSYFVMAQKT